MEGWLACLTKLGIPEDNLAWAKATPAPELSEPLAPYSPVILPDFDEEEYMKRSKKDKDVADAVVPPVNEIAQLTEEAGRTNAEEAGEDETQDSPLEL